MTWKKNKENKISNVHLLSIMRICKAIVLFVFRFLFYFDSFSNYQ